MKKGKIYQAYNKITGKSYIGQTQQSLHRRKCSHYYESKKLDLYKFHHALNKYNVEDWEWTILEKGIEKEELNNKEIYYISKFNSFKDGYNSTLGGGGINRDHAKIHKLYHKDHGCVEATAADFRDLYAVNITSIGLLSRGLLRQVKGWYKTEKLRDTPKKRKPNHIRTYIVEHNGTRFKGSYAEIKDKYNITYSLKSIKEGKHSEYKYIKEYIDPNVKQPRDRREEHKRTYTPKRS